MSEDFVKETQRRLRVVKMYADDSAEEMIERGNFPHMPLDVMAAIDKVQCFIALQKTAMEDIEEA